ncbi:Tigger transposable element-derived protein 1 [Chionoecetes opilio]|uniref:Tigger transposable element-derived protein 1 n=1 Tax=Chionoecetes opilio TaxID=41210 RepID=A0A8J4XUV8_CHIOP|nr:Tigger transposable element-derived protein 1 [Chionoecetes opilio]
MDQGAIATFKAYYLRRTFRKMINAVDADENLSIRQFWKEFNIKNAIDNIAESWDEVTPSNMNAVWKKLWPECVHNFKGFPEPTPVVREIVNLAHTAGMDEVGGDIVELLASHDEELSNEDLMAIEQVRALEEETAEEDDPEPQLHLTRKILADVISKFESGIHDIVNNDPNRERSLKFENTVRSALTAYKMLHQEKVHQAQQTTITSFFTKPAATSPASSTSTSSDDDAPTSPQ